MRQGKCAIERFPLRRATTQQRILVTATFAVVFLFITTGSATPLESDRFIESGANEVQILAGVFVSPVIGPRRAYNYELTTVRFGHFFSPRKDGFGNHFEILGEVFGAGVFEGPGHGFGGGGGLVRYNILRPERRCEPYLQVGFGIQYSDAYHDSTQNLLGGPLEFDSQAGAGLRCFVKKDVSITVELDYHHISNGNTYRRNVGVNALGIMVGVSFRWPK